MTKKEWLARVHITDQQGEKFKSVPIGIYRRILSFIGREEASIMDWGTDEG